MGKKSFLQQILCIVLIISTTTMSAQNEGELLNAHQKSMAAVSALTATGNLTQLKTALNTGLDVGLTVNEIKEALVQLYAYCGFPRSLNAINTLMAVLEERKAKGITDTVGKDATPINDTADKYQTGKATLQKLTGKEEKALAGANAFAPAIDKFLKEHLFADIFSRDVLNYRQREFVTIAALAAMSGTEPQLQAHIGMGMNTGITEIQLTELFTIIEKQVSKEQAEMVRAVYAKLKFQK
jgi:4-carboxymuconolactone decarboxylase